MFRKKKKTRGEIAAEIEKMYQEKEITSKTLREDFYGILKSGALTAITGGFIFPIGTIGFGAGIHSIYGRIFGEEPSRLTDNAGWLIGFLGVSAIASIYGTPKLYRLTKNHYQEFKEHREEYYEKNGDSLRAYKNEQLLLEKRLEQTKIQASLAGILIIRLKKSLFLLF